MLWPLGKSKGKWEYLLKQSNVSCPSDSIGTWTFDH